VGGQEQQQFAPQGAVGNLLGQYGAPLGGALGNLFGQPALGQQIGNVLGTVGPMLPFAAPAPQPMTMLPPELDPMGSASSSWSAARTGGAHGAAGGERGEHRAPVPAPWRRGRSSSSRPRARSAT
jgi:hypothetical protein